MGGGGGGLPHPERGCSDETIQTISAKQEHEGFRRFRV